MIHTASLIHKGIVNIGPIDTNVAANPVGRNSNVDELEFGNKMAVLSGDFLLANASTGLAGLNNTQVRHTYDSNAIANCSIALRFNLLSINSTWSIPILELNTS